MVRKTVILDDDIVRQLSVLSKKEERDFSSALRYSLRIGLLAIQNPELTSEEIRDIMEAKAELEEGLIEELDIETV